MGGAAKTVLVVEDEAAIRMAATAALEDEGFVVLEVVHADEAQAVLEVHAADVHILFTDIHMPSAMNGLELAHTVCKRWPWIAVIITSGIGVPQRHEMPTGSHYLTKPYELAALVAQCSELASSCT